MSAETAMWQDVATLVRWLDENNPRTEHEIACRVMKIAEETGEVIAAYIGMTGQNPRKGVCATADDAAKEMCDVIVTAAVALATLKGAEGAEACLSAHFRHLLARAAAQLAQKETVNA